ncbi:MAG: hypothetical protein COU26_02640 [Candidatus Levybacteria bacterium CG10_big_fil_rev_8_21_14_0_10_36_30]|nr:MAG: hypothetical protein COU26_02640 [Candidatus Levybacteria bacterium CG10_big_fil_rev_8_21_14_0_10_36_30]
MEQQIAALSTRLISIRDVAPGSEHHQHALKELMTILASDKKAVDVLAKQQGREVQNDDRI